MWRRRVVYVIFWILLIYLSIMYDNYALGVLTVFALFVPLLSLCYVLVLRKKVQVELLGSSVIAKKNEITAFRLQFVNHSHFPTGIVCFRIALCDVYFRSVTKEKFQIALAGEERRTEEVYLTPKHCGRIELSVNRVWVYDPMKLFRVKGVWKKQAYACNVYPAGHAVAWLPEERQSVYDMESDRYSTERPGDDPAEVFGVREYRPGDKLNRVHWNLTVTQDKLIVKELGLPIRVGTAIFVDLSNGTKEKPIQAYDAMMETVFSLSRYLLSQERVHYIVWYDGNYKENRRVSVEGDEDLYAAMDLLFGIAGKTEQDRVLMNYFSGSENERYANLFYIAYHCSEKSREWLRMLSSGAMCMYCQIGGTFDKNTKDALPGIFHKHIPVDHVETALKSVGEGAKA